MKVVNGLSLAEPGRRVVALGTFDAVHLGHRSLVEEACREAVRHRALSCVLTFDPMPIEALRPDSAPPRLSGVGRRAALVGELGPDELLIVRFSRTLAALSPERFVLDVLVNGLGACHVVCGSDYRFGHRAEGDSETLRRLGAEHGFGVTGVPLVTVEGERVSSSWIRELVAAGEVAHAARLLGRPPWLDGWVVRGDGRGRQLGVPTANLAVPRGRVVPALGVYAGWASVDGARHRAAISVGRNPTFGDDRAVSVEAYLLDFDDDVYGLPITVEFHAFVRHELRFESVQDLIDRMWLDIARCDELLAAAESATAAGGDS